MASTIPEGGFKDREGFQAWLESLAEEQRMPFAGVLAHRAALRVLPFAIDVTLEDGSKVLDPHLILSVFRANIVSRAAGMRPTRLMERAAVEAANSSIEALSEYVENRMNAVHPAYSAAVSSAYVTKDMALIDATLDDRTTAWMVLPSEVRISIWQILSWDAQALQKRGSTRELINRPLWKGDPPKWWQSKDVEFQFVLRLFSEDNRDEQWPVWLNWYNPIISGQSPWDLPRATANELEKRIALGDGRDDFWDTKKRKVAEINAEIAGWVEEARARLSAITSTIPTISEAILDHLRGSGKPQKSAEIYNAVRARGLDVQEKSVWDNLSRLNRAAKIERVRPAVYKIADQVIQIPQTKGALQFDGSEGEPIGVRKHASVEEWDTGTKAEKRHAEALRRLDNLLNQCREKSRDSNLLSQFLAELEAFRGAFGASVAEFDPDLAISQADALRKELARQKANLAEPMDMDDINPLPGNLVQQLDNTISAYNLFISLDDALSKRDEALLGPDAKRNLVPPREGQRRIEQAVEAGAAKPEVKEYLDVEAKPAPDVPDPENRLSRRYSESNKNYFRRHIELAWNWVKANPIKTAVGTTSAGYAAAQFVWHNRDWLVRFFDDSPTMLKILGELLDILAKLPLG